MATIITQTADNARQIQAAFRETNRHYPLGVCEAIFDFINATTPEGEYYHFDVVAWWCDICETALANVAFDKLDEFVDYISDDTTILYVDEDNETVYYLNY